MFGLSPHAKPCIFVLNLGYVLVPLFDAHFDALPFSIRKLSADNELTHRPPARAPILHHHIHIESVLLSYSQAHTRSFPFISCFLFISTSLSYLFFCDNVPFLEQIISTSTYPPKLDVSCPSGPYIDRYATLTGVQVGHFTIFCLGKDLGLALFCIGVQV
ncbi:MAG TPA: hypothetical protein VGO47_14970 [Chlamydiales bacterium]|jgi:hypothetical protein|nr:hypothetical protein [Chlamydiales bacterium]